MRQASLIQVFICFSRYTYIPVLNQSCETHRRLVILNGQINDTMWDWSCKSQAPLISFSNKYIIPRVYYCTMGIIITTKFAPLLLVFNRQHSSIFLSHQFILILILLNSWAQDAHQRLLRVSHIKSLRIKIATRGIRYNSCYKKKKQQRQYFYCTGNSQRPMIEGLHSLKIGQFNGQLTYCSTCMTKR